MKNLITLLIMALPLAGCIIAQSSDEYKHVADNDNTSFISDLRWYPDNDGPGYHCDPYVYQIKMNNHLYLVSVPSSCDSRPYIYKGDPGPDMGEELKNIDPIVQNEIIEMTIISYNLNYQ